MLKSNDIRDIRIIFSCPVVLYKEASLPRMTIMHPHNRRSEGATYLLCVVLLIVVCAFLFQFTLQARRPWFGALASGGHQWVTGSTIKFAKNWVREGAVSLGFSLLENPRSVEFPTLRSREPYPSYPPGAVLPIFWLSKLAGGDEPTPALVMSYNLANHFLIAVFLSLTIFAFLTKLKVSRLAALLFSFLPALLELLMPAPLYFQQNVFFADEAVILPFVLVTFFEVLLMGVNSRVYSRILQGLQAMIFFYGALTDWLFVFVALVFCAKRILDDGLGEKGRSPIYRTLNILVPTLMALLIFAFQILSLQTEHSLLNRFLFRVGYGPGKKFVNHFFPIFWTDYIGRGFGGPSAVIFLWAGLFVLGIVWIFYKALRRKQMPRDIQEISLLMTLVLLPCFLQVYTFRNHSAIHEFAALKFSVPFALVPFVLLPLLLYRWSTSGLSGRDSLHITRQKGELILALAMLLIAVPYALKAFPTFPEMFPTVNRSYIAMAQFIGQETSTSDVVFSPFFEIPANPPQALSYSMKRVYKIRSAAEIKARVSHIRQPFQIDLLVARGWSLEQTDWTALISSSSRIRAMGAYQLYRIDPARIP